jgi:hypothetical protein
MIALARPSAQPAEVAVGPRGCVTEVEIKNAF